ncbi:MAG: hypothetical protein NZ602_00285 [Thermoguttaceae bacterium]|nr:hypothetical protein [Thermoguttaceae bacterium]MDW8038618.1 hypothetical protein [Thermoguttaceae bacterium]
MKRTIPLVITFVCGLVLLAAHFSPYTHRWGEATMIWFDILASIAFLLGGGNLLKVHLKKVFAQQAGWAYSLVTVIAFLVTLWIGLVKWGVPPAGHLEHYGESFAHLPLEDFPFTYSVPGQLPEKPGSLLPASVRGQLSQADGQLLFRGWLLPNQKADLFAYQPTLSWRCLVERLAEAAQPPPKFRGKLAYYPEPQALAFRGSMTPDERTELEAMSASASWRKAVAALYEAGQRQTEVVAPSAPERFTPQRARTISPTLDYEPTSRTLRIRGPMSLSERQALLAQFPLARPKPSQHPGSRAVSQHSLPPTAEVQLNQAQQEPPASPDQPRAFADPYLADLWKGLQQRGPLTPKQADVFENFWERSWTIEQLLETIRLAGLGEPTEKTACQMLAEQQQGATEIQPLGPRQPDQTLSPEQESVIRAWASGPSLYLEDLLEQLAKASGGQTPSFIQTALQNFFRQVPTEAQARKDLCVALVRAGPLNEQQRDFLLAAYRDEWAWRKAVGQLFRQAHQVKYPWSGQYNAPGSPFWWIYEYIFKPLAATMFALLAFYVASAAFRAFRAKNLEAALLLGTAFIILLGRTAAGTLLTGWLPDWLGWLRVEELTVLIMSIFNTAGTRAIMIGIALGIVATSLKIILGMDRSYLGGGEK